MKGISVQTPLPSSDTTIVKNSVSSDPVTDFGKKDLFSDFKSWSKVVGFFGVIYGGLSFSAELFHTPVLSDISPGVTADTGIALVLAGTSVLLYSIPGVLARFAAGLSGATVAFLGFLRLFESNFTVDVVSGDGFPYSLNVDRMSIVTAALLALLGISLLLNFSQRRRFLAGLVSLIVFFIGFSAVLLRLYGVDASLNVDLVELFFPRTVIPPLAIVIMTTGLLGLLSTDGPMRLVTTNTPGGAMLRRLLPYTVIIPVALAWIKMLGLQTNFMSPEVSLFALVLSSILFLSGVLWVTATSINRSEARRAWADQKRKEVYDSKSAILSSALDGIITFDHDGRILEFNPAAERMFRYSRKSVVGKKIAALLSSPERWSGLSTEGGNGFVGKTLEMSGVKADGSGFPVEISTIRLGIPAPPMFTAFVRDITERKEAEAVILRSRVELEGRVYERTSDLAAINKKLQLLGEIAIAIGSAKSLAQSYEIILQKVCETHGFVIGQAWIPNSDLLSLRCTAGYSVLPEADGLRLASLDQTFRRSQDLPGIAWDLSRLHWSEDLSTDAAFTRTEFTANLGIESGLAVPIFADEQFLGVIEFFALGKRERDEQAVDLITGIATEVAGTLLRKQTWEELKRREVDLRRIEKSARIGTWRWEVQNDSFLTSEEFRLLHGIKGTSPSTLEHFLETVRPEDRVSVKKSVDQCLKTWNDLSCEYRIVPKGAFNPALILRGRVDHGDSSQPLSLTGIVLDVTELTRMREMAVEKENVLQGMIDAVKDYAIYLLDSKGMIVSWNLAARHIYGYWPDEVANKHWSVLFPDSEREEIDARLQIAVKVGRFESEGRRKRKDGSSFIGHSIVTPTLDEEGRVHGFTAVTRDITERKKAEKMLLERDLQLTAAEEVAKLGSWEWSVNDDKMSYSPELCRIIGLTPGDSLKDFLAVVHVDDQEKSLHHVQSMLATHKPFDFEQRIVRPDGTIRLLHTQGRHLTGEKGEGRKLIVVCHDVTDRVKAEKKFQDLLETAPDAMVILNQEGDIVIVNERAEEMFGFSREDLFGKPAEVLLPARFRTGKRSNYLANPTHVNKEQLELFGLRKDNSEFPVEVSTSFLETENGIMMSSTIRDISERKHLQAVIDETNRARVEDLQKLAGYIQQAQEEERRRIARELHDGICQKLSGMKLLAEGVENHLIGKDRKLARSMRNLSRQFESLIDDARRMAANLRPSVFDDFGLAVAVKLLARDFERTYGIHPTLDLDEDARFAPALEINLYRIVQEALSNIGKHTEASRVDVFLRKKNHTVHLQISDNGKGFDLPVSVRGNQRNGLGLMSMQERAKLTGGDFQIDSAPEKGTTISVTIPLVDEFTEMDKESSNVEAHQ